MNSSEVMCFIEEPKNVESRQVSADMNKHDSDISITEKGTKTVCELKTLSRINHIYLPLPYNHLPHLHKKILK